MTIVLGVQLNSLSASAFSDTAHYWAKADIQKLSDNNIMDGYSDGAVTSVQASSTALEIGSEVNVECGDQLEDKLTEPLPLKKKQLSSIR